MSQKEAQEMIECTFTDEKNENKLEQLDLDMQDNEEGIIVEEEDNMFSEEESFVENEEEEEEDKDNILDAQEEPNYEEVVAASIDGHEPEKSVAQIRPRRINSETGVERMQMEFM